MINKNYRESFEERLRLRRELGKDYDKIVEKPKGKLTETRERELEESKKALERLTNNKSKLPAGRPPTLDEFIERLTAINTGSEDETRCMKCRELYPEKLDLVTDGYCIGCAAELFYGDISRAVQEVTLMNIQQAFREMKAYNSQSEAQKVKRGMTDS